MDTTHGSELEAVNSEYPTNLSVCVMKFKGIICSGNLSKSWIVGLKA